MPKDSLPTSRWARAARVGRLAAGQGAKQLGTRAANVARGEDGRSKALEKRQIETAEQIVAVLGTMKGAAMKLGQVMSFLDVGLVPEEYREEFQAKLAELRDAAPKVSFKDMKKVIEGEYGEKIDDVFETFDPVPIAAASIGQVYRARLHDGRDVAVKVQYPGVAEAVRADMQNLGLILRLMKSIAPGLDARALASEVRERIGEELDYELEAGNQRAMARAFRGHPFIVVPDVVTSLSRERVVVTEFVSGARLRGAQAAATRSATGSARSSSASTSAACTGCGCSPATRTRATCCCSTTGAWPSWTSGCSSISTRRPPSSSCTCGRLGVEGRGEELAAELRKNGFITRKDIAPEVLLEQFTALTWWYSSDEEVQLTPEIATEVVIEMSDPRSSHFEQMRHENLPAEHLIGRRLETLTLAVLGQLRARANWFRIMGEWAYDNEPDTELGRAEAEYFATRA